MLKFQPLFAVGLGLALLVPALRSQDQKQGLDRALNETVRSLDVLAGIQRGIEARQANAIALARQATEPAAGDARVRDNRLATLRDEVNRLQAMSDRLDGATTQAREVQEVLQARPSDGSTPRVIVSTGLSANAREELAAIGTPGLRSSPAPAGVNAGAAEAGAAKSAGSPADPLRQAQVLYRAERWEECALVLKPLAQDAEASWWRARALEHLERWDEARECYRAAQSGAGKDTRLAQRAQQDLEFLEWKRGFAQKLAAGGKTAAPQPAAGAAQGGKP